MISEVKTNRNKTNNRNNLPPKDHQKLLWKLEGGRDLAAGLREGKVGGALEPGLP